jgi:hypothetical protein
LQEVSWEKMSLVQHIVPTFRHEEIVLQEVVQRTTWLMTARFSSAVRVIIYRSRSVDNIRMMIGSDSMLQ